LILTPVEQRGELEGMDAKAREIWPQRSKKKVRITCVVYYFSF